MESVGRIPCCGGVVIISVTGWGIKCLNMEILKEILSNESCTLCSHQDTYRVLDASIRLEHSVHRVAGYPGTQSNAVRTEDNRQCPI